jgi:hypothetical protein
LPSELTFGNSFHDSGVVRNGSCPDVPIIAVALRPSSYFILKYDSQLQILVVA